MTHLDPTPDPRPDEVEATDDERVGVPAAPVDDPAGVDAAGPEGGADGEPAGDDGEVSVEGLVADLERVTAERDEYLSLAQARQAEFENFRKRSMKQQADELARAAGRLVERLLPVLDSFDYGVSHGHDDLAPMQAQLLAVLEREGLERLDPCGQPFDPNEHEAVAHEQGDDDEHVVTETMRAGYRWNGRLLRPAMVKVRG